MVPVGDYCPDDKIYYTYRTACECIIENYYNKTKKECIYCPSIDINMIRINNSCGCNPPKYVLSNDNDRKCVCDSSKYGYNIYEGGECTNCSTLGTGMILKNGECICNPSQYIYNSTIKRCIKCSSLGNGFIPYNGNCVCDTSKYEYNFYGNNDCTNCSKVSEGMYFENGKCVCNDLQYVFNSTSKKCIKCSTLDKGMIPYNGSCQCNPSEYIFNISSKKCIKCSSLGKGMIPYNGQCICDSGYEYNFYGNNLCIKCSDISSHMIEINGKCECENGTYRLNINGQIICSIEPCKTYNPCNNNGICDFINNSYVCTCNNGYFGMKCSSSSVGTALFYFDNNLYSYISYNKIISNLSFVNLIKQISLNFENIPDYFYQYLYNIKKLTISIIDDFNNNNYSVDDDFKNNIIEYIGLTLFYQNFSSLKLYENEELTSQKIHLFYKKLFSEDFSSKLIKNKIISSVNNMFFYILWDFKNKSYDEYISTMDNLNLPYLNKNENNNVDIILHTIVNQRLDKKSNDISTTLFDNNKKEINDNLILIVSYNLLSRMNNKYYFDYLSKGINIYNLNDPAFTDECYRNKEFKYDLTNNYRKTFIYHHINSSCIRRDIEDNLNLYFLCRNEIPFSYQILNDSSSIKLKNNTRNLSFKCITKINEIMKNIAFWVYSSLILILIIISVLLLIFKSDYTTGEDIKINDEFNSMICITQQEKIDDEKANMQTPIYISKSLFQSFKFNISHFHPIICLFYRSILSPLYFKFWILIFNISNLFGLNALFYNEKLVEKKIFNKYKDGLLYPLLNDYIIIIESIIASMILTFLMKLINLTSFKKKNKIAQCFNIQNEALKHFEKVQFKKRIVAEIIMIIISFLMFICSLGFCYIYFNTQRTWFYAGIWSLFFIWILLAPFFIFLLSIFESISYNEKIIYYMKRLLCF